MALDKPDQVLVHDPVVPGVKIPEHRHLGPPPGPEGNPAETLHHRLQRILLADPPQKRLIENFEAQFHHPVHFAGMAFIGPQAACRPAQEAPEHVCEDGIEGCPRRDVHEKQIPDVDAGLLQTAAAGIEQGLHVMGVEGDIAGDAGLAHPEHGVFRGQLVPLQALGKAFHHRIDGNALAGVVPQAFGDGGFGLLHEHGGVSLAPQDGLQQATGQPVPIGQHDGAVCPTPHQIRIQTVQVRYGRSGIRLVVVAKRPHGRFDTRLIAHAGIVLVQLQHEIGLIMGGHQLLEVVLDKCVGRALDRGHQDGIEAGRLGRSLRGRHHPGGIAPVNLIQQRPNGLCLALGNREHILIAAIDPLAAK